MYIEPNELTTHLGAEQIEAISDGDETMLQAAIDAAFVEAKSYLKAFDVVGEFAKTGTARNALLIIFIKDIAVWHFINTCSVNTVYADRKDRYERAISWLRGVQKGEVSPDIEALPADEQAAIITYNSNTKRNNHY